MPTAIYNAFWGFISPDMILHNLLMHVSSPRYIFFFLSLLLMITYIQTAFTATTTTTPQTSAVSQKAQEMGGVSWATGNVEFYFIVILY